MAPAVLIATLRRRGCTLTPEGEYLRVAPSSRLTDELRAEIRAHKAAILAALTSGILPCPQCGAAPTEFECCWSCRGRLRHTCGAWMVRRP